MVIIGAGPGGYEAASVAAAGGVDVTVVEETGIGGAAVLTDCVPSKTLIATAEVTSTLRRAAELGLRHTETFEVDLDAVNSRVRQLAQAQSDDISRGLERKGVRLISGRARLATGAPGHLHRVVINDDETIDADIVLLATGTTPRELPAARCDGERILTWKQVYSMREVPEHLIVVGSGVTGAEFASAYDSLGCPVTLVSSRDQVLPGEDPDAAQVLQQVFESRGMEILSHSRAVSAIRDGDAVVVGLEDGRTVRGSHVLMAVGSTPNSADLGLEEVGVAVGPRGHITVDKVSRTNVPGIYAAGDCTGVFALSLIHI